MVRAQQDRSANQACEERLTVPVGTLLGWSDAPAQAGAWGLLDPDETRDLVAAASRHPHHRGQHRLALTPPRPHGSATCSAP